MELGAVGEHQRDRVAALQPELRKAPGECIDALAQLSPCDGEGIVLRADRDVIAALGRRDAKGLGDRRRAERCPVAGVLCNRSSH